MKIQNMSSNMLRQKIGGAIYSFIRGFFLISVSYVVVFPLIYMLSKSLISGDAAIDPSIVWLPREISFANYAKAFKALDFMRSAGVTLGVHMVSALLETAICSWVAYGLARFKFKGNNLIFWCVIVTIIVPSQAIIVPLYLNFSNLDILGICSLLSNITGKNISINILNTGWSFYLPAVFGVGIKSGLFIFIFRQFFRSFPAELEEAASIDGAGPIYTFLKIVVPSSGIAYLCVVIFSVIAYWNDYYLSVMFFKANYPLAVSLKDIGENITFLGLVSGGGNAASHNITMTGCLLFILPVLILYLILQKKFIQSIERIGIVG